MPCIQTTTNVRISDESRKALERRFGKAIEIFPGKTEQWLMLTFSDNTPVCMAGSEDDPAAFVTVSLLGQSDRATFSRMSGEICAILADELQIPGDRVYIKYEEVRHWGWNGSNF